LCETSLLKLREERRLRVFESRGMRGILGPNMDEVTGEWKNFITRNSLYVLLTQYCAVIKSRKMRWTGHVARMGEGRGVCRVLVGKPEGKRPLGRPWHR
jgi:hypothetical protein